MTVKLTIQSDNSGTDYLLDNNITILRPQSDTDTEYEVINSLFPPFGHTNVVEYSETYFEYASAISSIKNNEIITLNLTEDVTKGNVYSFTGTMIEQADRNAPDTQFGLENVRTNNTDSVVCGYGENFSINNNSQVTASNVISLAYQTTVFFEPTTKIFIFTSQGLETNMVIPNSYLNPNQNQMIQSDVREFIDSSGQRVVVGNYLEVDMNQSQTIHFNSQTNQFEMGGLVSIQV